MKLSPANPQQRATVLQTQQRLKMARSAHAYVRGNTSQFYKWIETSKINIPKGPAVWICGDCHVGNLGPVGNADGKVEIEIRDLDQTVIGNPAHDLIRLALSLFMASRSSDLPGVTTALMMEEMMTGYTAAFKRVSRKPRPTAKFDKPIRIVLREALNRKWRHLATERIEDVRPSIPLGRKFWALTSEEKKEMTRLFDTGEIKGLVTCLRGRKNDAKVELLDAAYWMKGCSSLGHLRYAVLVSVADQLCLIDIKEAAQTCAPGYKSSPTPRNHAERIVAGARALSPYLGERMLPAKFLGKHVVVRELRPQDLKVELEQLTQEEAVAASKFLAAVVGRAHARQMAAATRRQWVHALRHSHTKTLDAPGWLWSSVVELVAAHETAYLEHCRRYALSAA